MSIVVNADDPNFMCLILADKFTAVPIELSYWVMSSPHRLESATISWLNWADNKQSFFTTATTPEELIDLHPELFI